MGSARHSEGMEILAMLMQRTNLAAATPPVTFTQQPCGEDPLAAAKGIGLALLVCVPFWAIVGYVIYLLAR